jgi:hypothetical protein
LLPAVTDIFFSICLIAPSIKRHGMEYEHNKLQEVIANGKLTLEHTTVKQVSMRVALPI